MGTSYVYKYNVYKLAEQDRSALASNDNIFSMIMLTAFDALQQKQSDEQKLEIKVALTRLLLSKGYTLIQVRDIFLFIKHYTHFAESGYLRTFDRAMESIIDHKTTYNMGIEEYVLNAYREAGFGPYIDVVMEKGMEKGIEKGIEKGMEKGISLKEREVALNLWNLQALPLDKIALVTGISRDEVTDLITAFLLEQGKTKEEAALLITAYTRRFSDIL
jgi:hypothetical protein